MLYVATCYFLIFKKNLPAFEEYFVQAVVKSIDKTIFSFTKLSLEINVLKCSKRVEFNSCNIICGAYLLNVEEQSFELYNFMQNNVYFSV